MSSASVQFCHVLIYSYWETILIYCFYSYYSYYCFLFLFFYSYLLVFNSINSTTTWGIFVPSPADSVCQRSACLSALFLESCPLGAVAERCPAAQVPLGWTGKPMQRQSQEGEEPLTSSLLHNKLKDQSKGGLRSGTVPGGRWMEHPSSAKKTKSRGAWDQDHPGALGHHMAVRSLTDWGGQMHISLRAV